MLPAGRKRAPLGRRRHSRSRRQRLPPARPHLAASTARIGSHYEGHADLTVGAAGSNNGRREFEEFSRTAEKYIRAAREYLGEPRDLEMTISCGNASEITPVINQMGAYHIRSLRHYHQQRISDAERAQATLEGAFGPHPA
jgi:hypothetical protein